MDLISREAAIEALNMNGCCGMGITYLLDCDSVPAVPLEPLAEWLAGYAEPPLDALTICVNPFEAWKMTLTELMEEQDAKEET